MSFAWLSCTGCKTTTFGKLPRGQRSRFHDDRRFKNDVDPACKGTLEQITPAPSTWILHRDLKPENTPAGFPITQANLYRAEPAAVHRLARALGIHLCQCDEAACQSVLVEAVARAVA